MGTGRVPAVAPEVPAGARVHSQHTDDGILLVTLDDDGNNTLDPEVFAALHAALEVDTSARAVVLAGRPGVLTAGLDLTWMGRHGRGEVEDLLTAFGDCVLRWWTDPRPTVCAATGHAVAAGTILAMACDHAVAARGGAWGLTETGIGFEVPEFAIALARANVRADRVEDLLLPGARVDAAEAVDVGYADELAPPELVLEVALRRARERAALPAAAYAGTKARLRARTARGLRDGLAADVVALAAALP